MAEKIHIEAFAGSFQERSLIIPTPGIILGRFGIAVEPFWKPFQALLQVPSWKSITWRTVLSNGVRCPGSALPNSSASGTAFRTAVLG